MEREQFVRENPELARKQDKEGTEGILRLVIIVTLGIGSICAIDQYCNDQEFRMHTNDIVQRVYFHLWVQNPVCFQADCNYSVKCTQDSL